jgi:hypothetical protein
VEQAVDDAVATFAAVAAQLPDGALAERVAEARHIVGSCVADAARLCAVGIALGPHLDEATGDGRFAAETTALVARARVLVERIEDATAQLVRLHLGLDAAADPAPPLAALADGWTEIAGAEVGPLPRAADPPTIDTF